jgi:ornithine carbamoyltransferase
MRVQEVALPKMAKAAHNRHFLDIHGFDAEELRAFLDLAQAFKAGRQQFRTATMKNLGMVFEKPSTRTRFSFEIAMRRLGGNTIVTSASDMQLGHGESLADTARVLSRYVDAVMLRTYAHELVYEIAANASIPVINGLTDHSHPCQILAGLLTFEERRGPIAGKTLAWVGDANNVCRSWAEAASRLDFTLRIAAPSPLQFKPGSLSLGPCGHVEFFEDPKAALAGAGAVITDCWVSMGDRNAEERAGWLAGYQVDSDLMAHALPDALFMHCLPAHRGEEVSDSVIDSANSVVFDEAENRIYVQQAILAWCLGLVG